MVIYDLFAAGTETTTVSLMWALLFLLHHPEVQAKCYREICTVVGPHRPPAVRDQRSMPYLEATIREVLRKGDVCPMSLSHGLAKDVTFRGFFIPRHARSSISRSAA